MILWCPVVYEHEHGRCFNDIISGRILFFMSKGGRRHTIGSLMMDKENHNR